MLPGRTLETPSVSVDVDSAGGFLFEGDVDAIWGFLEDVGHIPFLYVSRLDERR